MIKSLTLGELTQTTRPICYGVLKPGLEDPNGVPLIRVTDISSNIFDDSKLYKITRELDSEFKRSKLKGGEVLLSIQGTVGKVVICPDNYAGANISRTIAVIEPDERLNKKFLRYYLIYLDRENKHYSTGSTRASLNISYLRKLKIPLPPLDKQKKIAAILDAADAYRSKTKALIAKYEQLTQSLFLDMFGDPVANTQKWNIQKLKDLSIKIGSGNTPKGGKNVYVEDGITFFRSMNVWKNNIVYDDIAYIDEATHMKMPKSSLKHRDILMTKTGRVNTENSSLGRAALYLGKDNQANINGHVYLIRLKEGVLHEFILHILTTKEFREHIRRVCVGGIDKRQLNKDHIEDFPIINPPKEQQQKFVDISKQIQKQKEDLKLSLKKAEELFNSLLQKAFKGELVKL